MSFSFGTASNQPSGFGSAGFGASGSSQHNQAGTLFGAGTQNTTSAFGTGSSSNTSAGTLFGTTPSTSTTTSGPSFGGFGSTTSTASGTSFSFGNTPSTGTGFGASTGTSTSGTFNFGNMSSAPSASFGTGNTTFGTAPATSTTGTTFGFGNTSTAPNTLFSGTSSTFGAPSTGTTFGFGQQQQQAKLPGQTTAPPQNIWQQLALIRAHFDPSSHLCRFRHYFYNVVPPNERHLYVKPPNEDEQLWNEAMRHNPDPSTLVPVLAVGFGDVSKRMLIQEKAAEAHRDRLNEISDRLLTIRQKLVLGSFVKLEEQRRRHVDLVQRLIRLLRFVQVLRYKGFPLQFEEQEMLQQLKQLAELPFNPEQLNAKLREVWNTLQGIKRRRMINQAEASEAWRATSQEDIDTIAKLLEEQQQGLRQISSILHKDREEIENIEEGLKSHVRRDDTRVSLMSS